MLACHIVRDLLPSYLEHLTAPETDADIRAHLEGCPACRAAEAAMRADLPLERAPQPRLQFLKKLRWQQRLGAGLSALVTVLCLLGLYRMEYAYTLTGTAEMEAAVETYLADVAQLDARYQGTAVDVLETEPVGNQVLVLYRLENGGAFAAQGVARFERGILGGYRLRTVSRTDWPLVYSQVVKVQSRPYLVVTCANAPGGAETFRVFARSDAEAEETGTQGALLYEGAAAETLLRVAPLTEEEAAAARDWNWNARYYDEAGQELDGGALAEVYRAGAAHSVSGGNSSDLPPEALYVWSAIVLLLGFVITRYFLVP